MRSIAFHRQVYNNNTARFGKYVDKYRGLRYFRGLVIHRKAMWYFSELTYIQNTSEHFMGYSEAVFQIFKFSNFLGCIQ